MDIEIIFHGVPSGQDYYGIKEEWTNVELFYDSSTESIKFVTETKKQGGKAYTYYTYLRYGLRGSKGRSGSYFGLTLRFDQYYTDVSHIYNLLEIVFKRHIIGTLLTPVGDAYKYTIDSFSQKTTEVNQAQQALIQLILTTCDPAKFLDIDDSFIHPITVVPTANITDVSEATMLASIKKYSKVILSPVYEMKIEKEYKKKIQDAEGRGGNIVVEKDKIITQKNNTIASLNSTIASRDTKIATLEQEVKRKDQELLQNRQKGDIAQLISKVKEPITALSEYFRIQDSSSHKPSPKFGAKNFKLGVINGGLSVCILLCVIVMNFVNFHTEDATATKETIEQLQIKIATLTSDINTRDEKIAQLNARIEKLSKPVPQPTPTTQPKQLRIDVKGYSSGKLSTENSYDISIKEGNKNNYNGEGTWDIQNADIVKGSVNSPKITIKPNGKGKVTLKYNVNSEGYAAPAQREFAVTSPSTSTPTSPAQTPTDSIQFKIAIEPNVAEVEIGKEYTFTVQGYDGKGKWGVDGFEPPSNNTAISVKVKAWAGGTGNKATISYTPEGKINLKKTIEFNYKTDD